MGYRTQAIDTSIEAEKVQFDLWRKMTPKEKEALFQRVVRKGSALALMGIKNQFPNSYPSLIKQQYIRRRLGQEWADFIGKLEDSGELMLEDPIWLAHQLATIFNSLNIPYYVGGSVASSLQGEVRFTQDLDLVINIQPTQIDPLIKAMTGQFYISEVAVDEAIRGRTSSFNIIHLTTTEKADLFVMRDDEFSRSQMSRRQLHIPDNDVNKSFYICSPEDTVLQKLLWFRMTARESQKQWRDILGVLKLQGENLDFGYLNQWAEKLQLIDLLAQALQEAGLAE
ncbi:hypothetical protein ACE1B6_25030 [Aerosakkonemataceae cyanobacterium BLCC-F154]|uniref:Uncharacterized protein n=1 Tax=Floridaenema fluviatile BLCC-F154 TaxID=3153640 RepID=A0ABV4YI59_9CYAN